jgi:hypothetical protein
MVPVLLSKNCGNVVVWRPASSNKQQQRAMYMDPGEVRFSRVFAMSGNGRNTSASPCDDANV